MSNPLHREPYVEGAPSDPLWRIVEQAPPPGGFGLRFTYELRERLADGTEVFAVSVEHFAAPAPVVEGEDEMYEWPAPARKRVGLVWSSGSQGWTATVELDGDDWATLVTRATRSFPTREAAAVFLFGFDAALRWQRAEAALAALPWRRPAATAQADTAQVDSDSEQEELPQGRPHGVI